MKRQDNRSDYIHFDVERQRGGMVAIRVDLGRDEAGNAVMAAAGPAKHVHPDDYSPPLFVLSEAEVAQLSIALIPATGTQAMFFCCLPDTGEYASMLFDAAGRLNVVKG